jgi:chitodextrinase
LTLRSTVYWFLGSILAATALLGLLQVAGSKDTSAAVASDPVLLLAGDISKCSSSNDEATAKILDAYPSAAVQTLGDNVYEDATASDFANCYQPTWGRHKARTRPAAGNHEYQTTNATPYFNYFGAAAGDPKKGYYSYDLGAWHIVVLNSNCSPVGGCSSGSPQERWLRADLAAHPAPCTLAVWHHPRYSARLATSSMQAAWKALSDYGADVVMAGHSHHYERFALLGPSGSLDANGIRSFVVGTGGADLHSAGSATTGSQVRNNSTWGVMKLTLHGQSYDWAFLPKAGQTFTDSGSEACRGAGLDATPPTQPTNLSATTPLGSVDLAWQASTDNVGVAGYDVLRNGTVLATTGSVTSYTDSTAAPLTTYTYEVRARDAAGNLSPLSNAVTVTTPEAPTLHTYAAVADARVEEANPSTNYGTSSTLRTDAGPAVETYLRFDVTGLSGAVQSARLRLYATNSSADGPSVRTTANTWGETTLSWSNRPAPIGAVTDDRGSVPLNAYTEWDVTPSVTGDGTVSFVLAQPGTDSADFASRDAAANTPELIVAVEPTPPPSDTTPPTSPTGLTAVPSPGRVDLEWQPASDNVAVTGYEVFRNGALLVELGALTSYADTTVAPTTQYTYEVRALDAAGNRSSFSNAASATTPGSQQTLTFAPLADARVEQANATTNYGTSTTLRTVGGTAVETNLRFDVGALPAAVQSAKLRLYVTGGTVDGPAVYGTGEAGWAETSLTWANRPGRTSPALDDHGAVGTGYAEWDVTSLVPPSGEVALVLAQTSTDGTNFNSREATTDRPQLVVTLSGTEPPPDTTAPSKPTGLTANAVAGRVDLAWQPATDEVAVTGYDIFRNGAPLASVGSVTTYADTSVAPTTSYTYTVRARDAAGNMSPLSDPATVTTPGAPQTLTFSPVADARVEAATPDTNFGTATLIGTDFSPDVDAYLTFDVSGLSGTVKSARLRLYAPNGSVDGPAVYQTATGWGEMTLTWTNRPVEIGGPSDDRVAVTKNAWSEWDVTPFVTGNGALSFLLTQPGTDGADFYSREATAIDLRPQLVVTTAP